MKVFDVVPEKFFSVLSSKNKELYIEAIYLLDEQCNDIFHVRYNDYVCLLNEKIRDKKFENEDTEESLEHEQEYDFAIKNTGNTGKIISRLINVGWFSKEVIENEYEEITERIFLNKYAKQMVDMLKSWGNEESSKSHLMYNIHSSLCRALPEIDEQNVSKERRVFMALKTAKENTNELIRGLNELYNNISEQYNMLTKDNDLQSKICKNHSKFDEIVDFFYIFNLIDAPTIYSDPIRKMLDDIGQDETLIQSVAEIRLQETKGTNIITCINRLKDEIRMLKKVYNRNSFQDDNKNIMQLNNEIAIKKKNYVEKFTKAIKFLMTTDGTKGKIISILKKYATSDILCRSKLLGVINSKLNGDVAEEFSSMDSLVLKMINRSKKKDSVDEDVSAMMEINILSEHEQIKINEERKKEYEKKYSLKITTEKINTYISSFFKENIEEVNIKDISISGEEDVLFLMMAFLRSSNKNINYETIYNNGKIDVHGYCLPNISFVKKRG